MTRPSGDAAHVSADVELTDGAALTFADRSGMGIFAYSRTNGSYYFDEVVVEVAEGGVIDMRGWTSIQLGGNHWRDSDTEPLSGQSRGRCQL